MINVGRANFQAIWTFPDLGTARWIVLLGLLGQCAGGGSGPIARRLPGSVVPELARWPVARAMAAHGLVYHDSDHSARCQALLQPELVGPGGVTTRGFGDQLQHTSNVDYFIFNALLVVLVVLVAAACEHEHAGVKFSHNTITLPTFSNVL